MHRLSLDRARDLLGRIRSVHVLVVGDLMLDVYLRGGASRISPEAPVPVVRVRDEWRALGGAANVAANLEALGAHAAMLGVVGDDAAGRTLREEAEAQGIEASGVVEVPGRPTTMKTRVLVGHQQVARYDREEDGELGAEAVSLLCERVESLAAGAGAVVLEDYDKGVLVPGVIDAAMDVARRRDIPVVVDPKAKHFFSYGGSTVFKPNRAELGDALRARVQAGDPEWMDRTRKHLGCENLLVTLGSEGMALMTGEGVHMRVPAVARSVYDVSGAGDTVVAVIAATLAAGGTVEEGALLATHAAGVEVGKAGVVTVAPSEIEASVRDLRSAGASA